VAAD
jgi:hypothetical protein